MIPNINDFDQYGENPNQILEIEEFTNHLPKSVKTASSTKTGKKSGAPLPSSASNQLHQLQKGIKIGNNNPLNKQSGSGILNISSVAGKSPPNRDIASASGNSLATGFRGIRSDDNIRLKSGERGNIKNLLKMANSKF